MDLLTTRPSSESTTAWLTSATRSTSPVSSWSSWVCVAGMERVIAVSFVSGRRAESRGRRRRRPAGVRPGPRHGPGACRAGSRPGRRRRLRGEVVEGAVFPVGRGLFAQFLDQAGLRHTAGERGETVPTGGRGTGGYRRAGARRAAAASRASPDPRAPGCRMGSRGGTDRCCRVAWARGGPPGPGARAARSARAAGWFVAQRRGRGRGEASSAASGRRRFGAGSGRGRAGVMSGSGVDPVVGRRREPRREAVRCG